MINPQTETFYNFVTQSYDVIRLPVEMSVREAVKLVPQTPRAQRTIRFYLKKGDKPYQAMLYTNHDIFKGAL